MIIMMIMIMVIKLRMDHDHATVGEKGSNQIHDLMLDDIVYRTLEYY